MLFWIIFGWLVLTGIAYDSEWRAEQRARRARRIREAFEGS